jgi:uncharacterized SAM-binding protein YcdF (DUF218 family)
LAEERGNVDFRRFIITIIVPVFTFFSMEIVAHFFPSVLHYYLTVDDSLQKASAVVVLCGGSGTRALHGASLVDAGYADHLILTGTRGELTFVQTVLRDWSQRTENKNRISLYEISNTAQGAKLISDFAGKNGNGKIIVVSNGWHLRRVRALVFCEASVWWNSQFSFSAVPYEKDPIRNMSDLKRRDFILIESIKYLITLALIRSGEEPL